MKKDIGARWIKTGLTLLCVMLTLVFLAGTMGGCATLPTTPQEAHIEAGEALQMAGVAIGILYVTGAVDGEEFAALEELLEEAKELHGLVGVTLKALEDAGRAENAVEAMVAYQEACVNAGAIADRLERLIGKLKG